ncbi:cadherin-like protein 26 [Archocentrus centrarchus]|uniref:cadherin-like protein 26 n=1 Tax=Archocentrus centrarchus TaxID=63155 RepID=UPI0011EA3FA1|nr:cadherin-like protein 26 [Archocentrus centrarchus]
MFCFFLLGYCLSGATSSELLSRQRRAWITDSFEIEEGHPGPFPYVLGKVDIVRQHRIYFELYGEGADQEPMGALSIDKDSGTLYVHKAVDYEEKKMLELKFEARKMDTSIDTSLGIQISIKDINDNPPRFERNLYEINVDQEHTQGASLLKVHANDLDQRGTLNSTFHYEIKSVSPKISDTEFFIDESGEISFKGCLNHEVAEKFTVVVEAKDHGDIISLSSSTTVVIHIRDGNNHLPIISGQTGTGKVKELATGVSPLRLHVTDKDTPHTSAWRARYTVHGDEGEHFRIVTDLDTNDGILTVVKPLDFEKGAQRELLISVENEAPYYSCNVKERTSSGLWKVDTIKGHDPSGAAEPDSVQVTIEVEDNNDPPQFTVTTKKVVVEENAPVGTWVEKVTAVDPDSSHARDFVYKIGNDSAGWVIVNPHTGDITMIKTPDRESPHVVNGLYTILVYAVDNGNPPMTGTATLHIHVTDQNDNVPKPRVDSLDVCVSDAPTTTNIMASDPDDVPYGGPFTFELLGNVEGKWSLNPAYGDTAGLVKEPSVYAGHHTIQLKISDIQGAFGVYNLSVAACDCTVTPNCHKKRRNAGANLGLYALCIIVSSLLLLLFVLLMVFSISRKKREFITMQPVDCSETTLLRSNTEAPGENVQIPDCIIGYNGSNFQSPHIVSSHCFNSKPKDVNQSFIHSHYRNSRRDNLSYQYSNTGNQFQTTWNSLISTGCDDTYQFEDMGAMNFFQTQNVKSGLQSCALMLLHQKLDLLQKQEGDLLDYAPHIYTEEGDSDNTSDLQPSLSPICISEQGSFQDTLEDLGPKFHQLASICGPELQD